MSFIKLNSGKNYDFVRPTKDMIDIHDITHNLSKEQRFMNCLDEDWTVLMHVLLVYKLSKYNKCSDEELYCALHHDDPEAYLGDMATPAKELMRDYQKLYYRCAKVIEEKFKITKSITDLPDKVKWADKTAMLIEDTLFSNKESEWHDFTIDQYNFMDNQMEGKLSNYISGLLKSKRYQLKQEYIRLHTQLCQSLESAGKLEVVKTQ